MGKNGNISSLKGGSSIQYRKKEAVLGAIWSGWTNLTTIMDEKITKFRMPGSITVINSSNPGEGPELENTSYGYNIADNITTEDGYTNELSTTIGNMITKGTAASNINQWLASSCVRCYSTGARFFVYNVIFGNVSQQVIFGMGENYNDWNFRVRPVVSIASGVKLSGTGDNLGTTSNPYTLEK